MLSIELCEENKFDKYIKFFIELTGTIFFTVIFISTYLYSFNKDEFDIL
jgi:hypothetical protein